MDGARLARSRRGTARRRRRRRAGRGSARPPGSPIAPPVPVRAIASARVVLDAERPGFLARHVVEVAAHDLPRLAVGLEPPAVEPHRFVAEPLDAAEVVGDEHDRLAARP